MEWIKNSKEIENLEIEVCFLLRDNFYIGDPNNPEQIQDEKYRESVKLPSFDRVVGAMARTSEVAGNEDELANYYKQIVERAISLDKSFNEIRSYFWLRLWLWNTEEEIHISFPWYDSLSEMQQFFSWLKESSKKELYIDVDQGWQIDAVRKGARIHIRQTEPECDEEHTNASVPFEILINTATEVENRATEIISSLTQSLGTDVWTKYLQDTKFGTSEWLPGKEVNQTQKAGGIFGWLLKGS